MGLFSKKSEEQKSLTEKLVDKKGTGKKRDILSMEEQIVKRKSNVRHKKNKIALLTKKGRNITIIKIGIQNRNKKRRKRLGLNFNIKAEDRKIRDKIRDDRRKAKELKPL